MEVSSKVNLYDTLTMVIPGFLLLLMVQFAVCGEYNQWRCLYEKNSVLFALAIFIASYILGLIYNRVSFTDIVKCILKIFKCDCLCNKFLIFDFRNNRERIRKAGEEFKQKFEKRCELDCTQEPECEINKKSEPKYCLQRYYKAYYSLMEKDCLNSIPVLEAQVAFLKNMIPVILFYIYPLVKHFDGIFGKSSHLCSLAAVIFVIAITFVMYRIMVKIQDKIYFLVWEGDKYLND